MTIRVKYSGVTYQFRINVKKRSANQSTEMKVFTMTLKKNTSSASSNNTVTASPSSSSDQTKKTYEKPKRINLASTATGSFRPEDIIMIGDSRFVGMSNSVPSAACTWICKESMGLSWLEETMETVIKRKDLKGKAIVFNLGVNDPGNASAYVTYMKSIGEKLRAKGAFTFFMTVNPIDDKKADEHHYQIFNEHVVRFNLTVAPQLQSNGYGILDTYDYLVDNGFATSDGIHYTGETYKAIFSYMNKCIGVK